MNTPLFSILIAQYNNGQYFKDCYNSIIAQTYQNWEVIIVDDCSTDDSVEVMKKLIGEDLRFKIYQNIENKGCGFTKRKLVELAAGEICGFLDPDDTITEDAVSIMVEKHIENSEVSIVYSNCVCCDKELEEIHVKKTGQVLNKEKSFINYYAEIFAWTTFKKKFYDQTDGINENLKRAVDQDLVLRLYEVGEVVHVPASLYRYRQHERGISTMANQGKAKYWHWVVIMDAAKRRGVDYEKFFEDHVLKSQREKDLEKEISRYNGSFIFKVLRKLKFF